MKKICTWTLIFVLVFGLFVFAPVEAKEIFKTRETQDSYEARVSVNLQEKLDTTPVGEMVSVMIWTNSPIDLVLQNLKSSKQVDDFTSFERFGCYSAQITPNGIDKLRSLKWVDRIEEDYVLTLPDISVEDEINIEEENWGLDDLGVSKLLDKGIDGEGAIIGILDSGIDGEHPEFEDRIERFAAFDMGGNIDTKVEPFDLYGHGTHVAGIVCGKTAGVAPKAKVIMGSVMPTGSGTITQVIAGMEWMLDPDQDPETDDAPTVVSMSLGGSVAEDMVEIADVFERAGILLVASIGNEGAGASGSPGNIPSVLSVGAYDIDRDVALFSSGQELDWEYDPYHLTVTKPDVAAPGVDIYSSLPGGGYSPKSGTSMAAPHVAGVAALLLSVNPELSNISIRETIINTTTDYGEEGWDRRYGNGIVNPEKAVELIKNSSEIKVDLSGDFGDEPVELEFGERTYRIEDDTSFISEAGKTTSVELSCFGYEKLNSEIVTKTGSSELVRYVANKLPVKKYSGLIISENGNPAPGVVKFIDTPVEVKTDESGFFETEIPVDVYDVEFWGIGCEPATKRVDINDPMTRIVLPDTDVLVAIPQFKTPSQYHAQKYDKFCYKALDETNLSYCPVNPFKYDLKVDDLLKFDRVYWFGGPSDMYGEHSDLLAEYLDRGGKLMLSASNLMLYDAYRGYSDSDPLFIQDYFGLKSIRQGYMTTTLVGMENTDLGDGLVLALSGGDGASSQIGFDALGINSRSDKHPKPFLHYYGPQSVSVEELGYAGVSVESGSYAGIYLSFGFEVVNNAKDRTELLTRIENWFDQFGAIDMAFVDDAGTPVYSRVTVAGVTDNVESDDDNHVRLNSMRAGTYNISVSSIGFKKQNFEIEIIEGKHTKAELSLSDPASITFSGQVKDGDSGEGIECSFKITGKETKIYKTDKDGNFEVNLPLFEYDLKFYKKRYLHHYMELTRDSSFSDEKPVDVNLYRYKEKFAVVEQVHPTWATIPSGGWFFQGLAQSYDAMFAKAGYKPTKLIIPPDGKASLEDIDQFGTVFWLTGYNDELTDEWWQDLVADYVRGGGNLVMIGNDAPIYLAKNSELSRMLGFELESGNSFIFTIQGVADDPIGDGILISKYHPYIRNRLLTYQPAMKPVGDGVSCFDLVGGNGSSAGVWVKNNKQKTVILGFDMFDIFDDTETHIEIVERIIKFLE
ncbi:MAG: S8 family serine peptidase [Caldisericia bacterium]